MANEKTPVVWDDTTSKHRPLGTGEKMGGLDASSLLSSDSGNLLEAGSDGLAYLSGSGVVDPRADNLLEESDRGKLQVTVDRIAEWLDGHPQDAALLADAINVVSGDEGNVITAGSDKGAFLSKGAISAAVAGMTDAQKAQLADAIAARIASDIADGKTIVASGGKLTSDPTNATAAQKKAINQALADADSGLVVNNSTGKLQVDFAENENSAVTLGRFNPAGDTMSLKVGEVVRSEFQEVYCSPYYYIRMDSARDFMHQLAGFGHHQVLVFGDWSKLVKQISQVMGFKVLEG